jgi:hypothetical protein
MEGGFASISRLKRIEADLDCVEPEYEEEIVSNYEYKVLKI